jgi:hypothetical protein
MTWRDGRLGSGDRDSVCAIGAAALKGGLFEALTAAVIAFGSAAGFGATPTSPRSETRRPQCFRYQGR